MALKNKIQQSDEYQSLTATEEVVEQPATTSNPREAIDPVLSLEKSDVQFWLQVAQVLLLYLILRELQRGGI